MQNLTNFDDKYFFPHTQPLEVSKQSQPKKCDDYVTPWQKSQEENIKTMQGNGKA